MRLEQLLQLLGVAAFTILGSTMRGGIPLRTSIEVWFSGGLTSGFSSRLNPDHDDERCGGTNRSIADCPNNPLITETHNGNHS